MKWGVQFKLAAWLCLIFCLTAWRPQEVCPRADFHLPSYPAPDGGFGSHVTTGLTDFTNTAMNAAPKTPLCGRQAKAGGISLMEESGIRLLGPEDTIGDMLRHPSLAAFSIHMLPQAHDANQNLRLADVGMLMPWHSHIEPDVILKGINRLINDSARGIPIFYSFHTTPPAREQTGLFFFRGRPGAPFALICPGGGFRYVASLHEGFPLALMINRHGFNVFVLQYRTGGELIACEDLGKALSWIFAHARQLDIDERGYSVWGGSAGARLAADLGSYGPQALGAGNIPGPAAVITAYTGHNRMTPDDAPTFAVVSRDDPIVNVKIMEERIRALKNAGIEAEIRIFDNAGHGFGTGKNTDADGWVDDAVYFWKNRLKQFLNENCSGVRDIANAHAEMSPKTTLFGPNGGSVAF